MGRSAIAGVFCVLALMAPLQAQAQRHPPHSPFGLQLQDQARQGVRDGRMMPLGRILSDIRNRAPGSLLDAGLQSDGRRDVYRIRWLADDGRRIDYTVDARSGAILDAWGE